MNFQKWFNESNINDLYKTTVDAFPRTTKRQFSTDLVQIVELNWMPFLGVKTLFIKALAQSNESGKEYNPMILFKDINYHNIKEDNWIEIKANNGKNYVFERIENNDVLVRCDCKDFKFRFGFYNHIDHSLYGSKPKKYESLGVRKPANPNEFPGMCKHLLKLIKSLDHAGIFRN